jgi:superfamily II DNA/RNA helicase
VGTPGRLIDMMNREAFNLGHLTTLCIDEADEMLKMGFQEDIERIFGFIKRASKDKPQILLFSATIPDWVMSISHKYLK